MIQLICPGKYGRLPERVVVGGVGRVGRGGGGGRAGVRSQAHDGAGWRGGGGSLVNVEIHLKPKTIDRYT